MYKVLTVLMLCIGSSLGAMEAIKEKYVHAEREQRYRDIPRPKYDHPLLLAAHCGSLEEVKALVEGNGWLGIVRSLVEQPDLSACNWLGKNALHVAAERGSEELITYFVQKGIPVDCLTKAGETPLYLAAVFGHLKAVQALQRHGALLRAIGDHNPMNVAAQCGHTPVVEFLLQQQVEATEEDLFKAAGNGHTDVCAFLTRAGIMPKELPILAVAMRSDKPELAQLLLDAGCAVNYEYKGKRVGDDEATAVISASKYGNIECLKLLVAKGADISLVPENCSSALHWATAGKTPMVVCYLLRSGIDPLIGGITRSTGKPVPECALGRAARIEKDDMCTTLLLAQLFQVNRKEAAHRLRHGFWAVNNATNNSINEVFPLDIWAHILGCTTGLGLEVLSLLTQEYFTIRAIKEVLFGEQRHPLCKAWGYEHALEILASGTVEMAWKQCVCATQKGTINYPRSPIPFLKNSKIFDKPVLAAQAEALENQLQEDSSVAQEKIDESASPEFYREWKEYLRSRLLDSSSVEEKKKGECIIA